MYCTIEPLRLPNGKATQLHITDVHVALGQAAALVWQLRDDAQCYLSAGIDYMNGNAYTSWSSDDEYPLRYLAEKFGATILEIFSGTPQSHLQDDVPAGV